MVKLFERDDLTLTEVSFVSLAHGWDRMKGFLPVPVAILDMLGVSQRAVRNDWKLAKAWLYREITPE